MTYVRFSEQLGLFAVINISVKEVSTLFELAVFE